MFRKNAAGFDKPINRRNVLGTGSRIVGAATLLKAAAAVVPGGAWAAGGEGIEKTKLSLGIIPLTDCAPIVIAREKGFFKQFGLDVGISKEASWATIRDKVHIGALDGAHMLAGMPIASSLGIGGLRKPTITAWSMDLNGNAITVSNELYEAMVAADPKAMAERPRSARALKKVIDARSAQGMEPLTFAVVFPTSTHNYQLRYWMADAGIDPDRDVRIAVIPPPQMVANLQANNIVGYCVGEPWNSRAIAAGLGKALITSYEIWNNGPEKVLGVNLDWAEKHPNTHKAMIGALAAASQWMDRPENRAEVAGIISRPAYVNADAETVRMSTTGTFRYARDEEPVPLPDFNVFHRYAANFPWVSHASWFISQMIRWGQVAEPLDVASAAASIYRPDIYRDAVRDLGIATPAIDTKIEGTHDAPWMLGLASAPIPMGPDRFLDNRVFDPAAIAAYVEGFEIRNPKFDTAMLAATA
ncbi:CmpA/NrtA family ABC transporter substrate-binding protein [Parvibaculum sp.]|uniref:CmpA/NrtA family ABC transporter substrate-binding protein n=1 Tax=Parvibaculum sp. TaxID=2024848 RepID=UPI0034A07B19